MGWNRSLHWVSTARTRHYKPRDVTERVHRYVLDAHTNLTEIDEAFDLYWRAGVDPSQVVSV